MTLGETYFIVGLIITVVALALGVTMTIYLKKRGKNLNNIFKSEYQEK